MSKVAVVYWSQTGNTEAMANAVAEGVTAAGGEAVLITAGDFNSGAVAEYDAIAFGCPSMGVEVLEEAEVELPAGFTIEKTHGEGEEIFKGNEAADMITEYTDGKYVTSLVTSDGIVNLKVWNYGKN